MERGCASGQRAGALTQHKHKEKTQKQRCNGLLSIPRPARICILLEDYCLTEEDVQKCIPETPQQIRLMHFRRMVEYRIPPGKFHRLSRSAFFSELQFGSWKALSRVKATNLRISDLIFCSLNGEHHLLLLSKPLTCPYFIYLFCQGKTNIIRSGRDELQLSDRAKKERQR